MVLEKKDDVLSNEKTIANRTLPIKNKDDKLFFLNHRVGSFKSKMNQTIQDKKTIIKTRIRIHGHQRDTKTEENKLRSNTSRTQVGIGWDDNGKALRLGKVRDFPQGPPIVRPPDPIPFPYEPRDSGLGVGLGSSMGMGVPLS